MHIQHIAPGKFRLVFLISYETLKNKRGLWNKRLNLSGCFWMFILRCVLTPLWAWDKTSINLPSFLENVILLRISVAFIRVFFKWFYRYHLVMNLHVQYLWNRLHNQTSNYVGIKRKILILYTGWFRMKKQWKRRYGGHRRNQYFQPCDPFLKTPPNWGTGNAEGE